MRRFSLLCVLLLGLAGGGSAQAQTGTFFSFNSQPGDYIGQGTQQTFTPADSTFNESYDGSLVSVTVNSSTGGFWDVELAAPPGQPLVPGTYTGAVRAAFRGPGQPGIDVFGDGRGCNETFGTFTVNTAVYGPSNYVQTFDATFEQHCESSDAPALFGEISIANPPPPPPLALTLTVAALDSVSRVSGVATVTGTVSCSEPAAIDLSISLTQRTSRTTVASASNFAQINCTSSNPIPWSFNLRPGEPPFVNGAAQVDAVASALDPNFGGFVNLETAPVVKLKYH
jgi:hypothetical protein